MQEDFAAVTRISEAEPVASTSTAAAKAPAPAGPSFSAPSKVEPFLLLAKSARGAGAAKLVEQATAAPGVYVFGELLNVPSLIEVLVLPNLSACSVLRLYCAARQQ